MLDSNLTKYRAMQRRRSSRDRIFIVFPRTGQKPFPETEGDLWNLILAVDVRRFYNPQRLQARARILAFMPIEKGAPHNR